MVVVHYNQVGSPVSFFLLYKIRHAAKSSTFKITSNATNATGVVAGKYKLPLNIPRTHPKSIPNLHSSTSNFRLHHPGFALN
jgi:hypothetical protein